MLLAGVFQLNDGKVYTAYNLVTRKSNRLEILDQGADFHTDPDKVVYGIYSTSKSYREYGQLDLGALYSKVLHEAKLFNAPVVESAEWIDHEVKGRALSKVLFKKVDDLNYYREIHIMGKLYSQEACLAGDTLFMEESTVSIDVDLEPLNIRSYTDKTVYETKSAVVNTAYNSLEYIKTKIDLRWQQFKDYAMIESVEEGREYLKSFLEGTEAAIDYETNTLDFVRGNSDARVVGMVLSNKVDTARYFPFNHEHESITNLPWEFIYEIISVIEKCTLIAYNAKYENKVNMSNDFKFKIAHDAMAAKCVLIPKVRKGTHTLETTGEELTGNTCISLYPDIFPSKDAIAFHKLPKDLVIAYACPDADNTLLAHGVYMSRLPPEQLGIYALECNLIPIKAAQEWWGLRLDTLEFALEADNTMDTIVKLEDWIHKITHSNINLGSSQQIAELLYYKLNYPVLSYTKTGAGSTGAKVINKLAGVKKAPEDIKQVISENIKDKRGHTLFKAVDINSSKYLVATLLSKHRVFSKLKSSFDDRFQKNLSEKFSFGRIFFWVNQFGAESGRQSSPMHQLPKSRKKLILSDSSEHKCAVSDYSCIELRVGFSYAQEVDIIKLCWDKAVDIHRAIGKKITGKDIWEISAKERKLDKPRNFGVIYLISAFGLAVNMFLASPSAEQVEIAQKAIDNFWGTFRKYARFVAQTKSFLLEKGYVETYFNRRRYFPQVKDPTSSDADIRAACRQGNNMPVQGTAADVMKLAEINVNNYIIEKGWDALVETPEGNFPLVRVALSVHDEMLVFYHKSISDIAVLKMKKECMEMQFEDFAPLYADTALVEKWADSKEDKYAIPIELRDRLVEEYDSGKWQEPFEDVNRDMLKIINSYRDEELIGYMEGLIKTAGSTDVAKVAELVRHPSLTHDLINRFPQSDEHKDKYGEITHVESISYAVEEYMRYREGKDSIEELKIIYEDTIVETITDDELNVLSEDISYIDDKGEVVYLSAAEEDPEESDLQDGVNIYDDNEDGFVTFVGAPKIWKLQDMIIVDGEGCPISVLSELNDYLRTLHETYGNLQIKVKYGGKLLDTGVTVNELEEAPVLKMIERRVLV